MGKLYMHQKLRSIIILGSIDGWPYKTMKARASETPRATKRSYTLPDNLEDADSMALSFMAYIVVNL